RIIGTEALVRWRHETRGMILPTEFIPVAEQSGLIVALGGWVLRTACAQAAQWQADYPGKPPLTISVNLSPRQLAEPELLATVVGALRDSGLPSSSLCLEITEGSLIRDVESTLLTLGSLKAIGLRLALDDFGTGYSSLSYLQRLPVDIVKIDRSFVAELGQRQQERQIVAAVVELARALGLSVTAEGIETRAQLDVLREIGCDNGQGYLRSAPVPADQLDALLAQGLGTTPVPAPRGSAEEAPVSRA
ncbi:MAG: EAL domain-containing protein, partial [Mycobacteriales bacterium]